jgi:hypothetical protein
MSRFARHAFVLLTLSATARADDRTACVDAYKQAQLRRKAGALLEAREQLLVCSRDVCPNVVKTDCVPWLGEVTRAIVTIVVEATDADGKALTDVRVSADGATLTTRLDGRPIEIDPGDRVLRFETPGAPPVEQRVSLIAGERERRLRVTLARRDLAVPQALQPVASPPPAHVGPFSVPVVALGGVGVVGVTGFVAFGLIGNGEKSDLDQQMCKPNCPSSEVTTVERNYVIADVSLGVGVVSLAVAAVLFLTRSPTRKEAVSFDALPARGGSVVSTSYAW